MHRTQIMLEDAQYQRLRLRSKATGRAIGDLVREAIDADYGDRTGVEERRRAVRESAGALGPDAFDGLDGEQWVEQNRHGLAAKLDTAPTAS